MLRIICRRLTALCVLSAALCVAAAVATAGPAAACSPSSHCHGGDYVQNAVTNTGIINALNVSGLFVPTWCTSFINDEMWEGTQGGGGGLLYVEVGVKQGVHFNSVCGNGDQWFWAESYSLTGGYAEHYPGGSFGLNQAYNLKVQWVSPGWNVYIAGVLKGTSSQSCCSAFMQNGTEVATSSGNTSGDESAMQKLVDGTWSYGWANNIIQVSPVTAGWDSGQTGTALHFNYSGG